MITTIRINKSSKHQITIPIEAWKLLGLKQRDFIQIKINRFGSDSAMISTVQIPIDKLNRHHITIPIELWDGLMLKEGMSIQIEINKVVSPD